MNDRQTAEGVFEGHLSAAEEEHAVCASVHECAETSACYVAMKAYVSCHGWPCEGRGETTPAKRH